jgi:outer membrane protein OmpA-like peptidoglycan-associated protein
LKAIAGLILLIILSSQARAQNIIFNGSFEDENVCSELHQPCSPAAWFFVNRTGATGYYQNAFKSASGRKNIRIVAANAQNSSRQYWETMLAAPLIAGKKYVIGLKIASPEIGPNVNDIGFLFTDSMIFSQRDTVLQPGFYYTFRDAKITRLRKGWFKVSKEITAEEAAPVLIIGNFNKQTNSEILTARKAANSIVLLIDDVSVAPEDSQVDALSFNSRKDSLYAVTSRHSFENRVATFNEPQFEMIVLPAAYFQFDSYHVSKDDILDGYTKKIKESSIDSIEVVGYTDSTGTRKYNEQLSLKRAREVARLLIERIHVPAEKIRVRGAGVSAQYSEDSLNRRVEIHIYNKIANHE